MSQWKHLRFAFALLGLLVVAGILMTLGERESQAFPSGNSFKPSGTSAFAELLRKEGYSVEFSYEKRPKLKPDDVVVAFVKRDPPSIFTTTQMPEVPQRDYFKETIQSFVKGGGKILVLPLDWTLPPSNSLQEFSIEQSGGQRSKFQVVTDRIPWEELTPLVPEMSEPLLVETVYPFVSIGSFGAGLGIFANGGSMATNRYLDRADNAGVMLHLVSLLSPQSGHIVFAEGAFGNASDPSLLESIGAWAEGAWLQIVVLFVVVIYSLSKRFGFPEPERHFQRGKRELLEAIADTYKRGKAADHAILTEVELAESEIRKFLKLPRDAPRSRIMELVPETLWTALSRAGAAATLKNSEAQAVEVLQELDNEMRKFLHREVVRRKRKST